MSKERDKKESELNEEKNHRNMAEDAQKKLEREIQKLTHIIKDAEEERD